MHAPTLTHVDISVRDGRQATVEFLARDPLLARFMAPTDRAPDPEAARQREHRVSLARATGHSIHVHRLAVAPLRREVRSAAATDVRQTCCAA